jgi:hypothetical protein
VEARINSLAARQKKLRYPSSQVDVGRDPLLGVGTIAFGGEFRAAFRATLLWTLADVGFFVQRMNSFESEVRKSLAG